MLVVEEALQEHLLQQLVLVALEVEVQGHQHQQTLVLLELLTLVEVVVEQVLQIYLVLEIQERVVQVL
tara:strand:+ start:364 stop:567 length:204 start_codon:yes stop_codon:yes gene_type:complete